MKRRAQLRADPAKVRAWHERSRKALPAESARRKSEVGTRRKVKARVLARDGGCVGRLRVPAVGCWGPLDCHEIVPRSVWPGGHLVDANCVTLCRSHHEWVGANLIAADAVGLHGQSWDARS